MTTAHPELEGLGNYEYGWSDSNDAGSNARRVLNVEASSHSYRRNEATVFPLSFRLLPDPAFSGAEYGMIVDRQIAAS